MGQICGLGEFNFQIGEKEKEKERKEKTFRKSKEFIGASGEGLHSGCAWAAVAEAVPNFSSGFNDSQSQRPAARSEKRPEDTCYLPIACCSRRPILALVGAAFCLERNMSICFFVIVSLYC